MKMKYLSILFITIVLSCSAQEKDFTKKIQKISKNNKQNKVLHNGWYHISNQKNEFERVERKTGDKFYINPKPILIPENFKSHEEFENFEGDNGISVLFDSFGTKQWSKATDLASGSHLIFILNNKILSSSYVNSQITGGVSAFWKSEHTSREWDELNKILK